MKTIDDDMDQLWLKSVTAIEVAELVCLTKIQEIKFETETGHCTVTQQTRDKCYADLGRIRKELEYALNQLNFLSENVRKYHEIKKMTNRKS